MEPPINAPDADVVSAKPISAGVTPAVKRLGTAHSHVGDVAAPMVLKPGCAKMAVWSADVRMENCTVTPFAFCDKSSIVIPALVLLLSAQFVPLLESVTVSMVRVPLTIPSTPHLSKPEETSSENGDVLPSAS